MAELTYSRETLRQAICRKARMNFYRRYPAGQVQVTASAGTDAATNDTTVVFCTYLTQKDKFWNNSYIWLTDSDGIGQERRVVAYDARRKGLTVEWPLDTAASSSDASNEGSSFELTSIWSPTELHDAINDAIEEGYKHYPDIVTDQTLIIEKDRLNYTLSGLTTQPHYILKIWIERTRSGATCQMTTTNDSDGTGLLAAQLRSTGVDFSAINDTSEGYGTSDWMVSIYYGAGKSEYSEVSAVDTATYILTASSDWTTAPDTTTYYRFWNTREESDPWSRYTGVRFDSHEEPTEMYFKSDLDAVQGLRIKIEYVAQCNTLTADTEETQVPKRYILNKALAYLHDAAMHDNRASRQDHATLAQAHDDIAEQYALKHPRRWPAGTLWTWDDASEVHGTLEDNPMAWGISG